MPARAFSADSSVRQLWGYNTKRLSAAIYNNGAATVFLSQDQADVTAQGFSLIAGASISFVRELGDEPELAMYCQTAAATVDLRIFESYERQDANR